MNNIRMMSLSFIVAVLASLPTLASPVLLPVQGILRDAQGAPISDDDLAVTFRLVDGSGAVYEETQTLSLSDGLLVAYVGDEAPLDATLFSAADVLSLEIVIEGETLGAMELGSAPYAAFAQQCGTLGGDGLTDVIESLADGAIALGAGSTIGGQTIATTAQIPDAASIAAALDGVSLDLGAGTTVNGQTLTTVSTVRGDFALNPVALAAGSTLGGAAIATSLEVPTDADIVDAVTDSAIDLAAGTTLGGQTLATAGLIPNESAVEGYITDGAIALAAGSTIGGSAVQARVTGACAVGSSIRAINANGTVVCETPSTQGALLFVGSLTEDAAPNCTRQVAASSGFTNFVADNDCATPSVQGLLSTPATKVPGFVIPAGSPAGTYLAVASLPLYAVTTGAVVAYRLSDGAVHSQRLVNYASGAQAAAGMATFVLEIPSTASARTFQVQAHTSSGDARVVNSAEPYGVNFQVFRITE